LGWLGLDWFLLGCSVFVRAAVCWLGPGCPARGSDIIRYPGLYLAGLGCCGLPLPGMACLVLSWTDVGCPVVSVLSWVDVGWRGFAWACMSWPGLTLVILGSLGLWIASDGNWSALVCTDVCLAWVGVDWLRVFGLFSVRLVWVGVGPAGLYCT
jgi:hypothetical protein